jgi:hypothetical protein
VALAQVKPHSTANRKKGAPQPMRHFCAQPSDVEYFPSTIHTEHAHAPSIGRTAAIQANFTWKIGQTAAIGWFSRDLVL